MASSEAYRQRAEGHMEKMQLEFQRETKTCKGVKYVVWLGGQMKFGTAFVWQNVCCRRIPVTSFATSALAFRRTSASRNSPPTRVEMIQAKQRRRREVAQALRKPGEWSDTEDGYEGSNLSNTGTVGSGIEFLKAYHSAREGSCYISPDNGSDNCE